MMDVAIRLLGMGVPTYIYVYMDCFGVGVASDPYWRACTYLIGSKGLSFSRGALLVLNSREVYVAFLSMS